MHGPSDHRLRAARRRAEEQGDGKDEPATSEARMASTGDRVLVLCWETFMAKPPRTRLRK